MSTTLWTEITIEISAQAVEAMADALREAGAGGVVETRMQDSSALTAYFPADGQLEARISVIRRRLTELDKVGLSTGSGIIRIRQLDQADWESAWKDYFKAIVIGRAGFSPKRRPMESLVIKPTWEDFSPGPGQVVIEIDPGMAFGTGDHPTTKMCLMALLDLIEPGDRVIDVGTGSGILAIAAAKLGAQEVLAVDNDRIAIRAAKENVRRNQVSGQVKVMAGDLLSGVGGKADIIMANITAEAIARLLPQAGHHLQPRGFIILGGIVKHREDLVGQAIASARMRACQRLVEGEWITLVCQAVSDGPLSGQEGMG